MAQFRNDLGQTAYLARSYQTSSTETPLLRPKSIHKSLAGVLLIGWSSRVGKAIGRVVSVMKVLSLQSENGSII